MVGKQQVARDVRKRIGVFALIVAGMVTVPFAVADTYSGTIYLGVLNSTSSQDVTYKIFTLDHPTTPGVTGGTPSPDRFWLNFTDSSGLVDVNLHFLKENGQQISWNKCASQGTNVWEACVAPDDWPAYQIKVTAIVGVDIQFTVTHKYP